MKSVLQKAFEKKIKFAYIMHEVENEFNMAISDSKYAEIEIPDELIDLLDYGTGKKITFERFIEIMDEALQRQTTLQEKCS